jgi:hypothetical protein
MFRESRSLVSVDSVGRGAESQPDFAIAYFTFIDRNSPVPIKATAQLRFWEGRWHVGMFRYDDTQGNSVAVDVESGSMTRNAVPVAK